MGETDEPIPETGTAELLEQDGSQVVLLPEGFRLPGTEVRVQQVGRNVLLVLIEPESPTLLDE